jgi:hypothetical protein
VFETSIKTKLDTDEEVDINMMEERFEKSLPDLLGK